MEGRVLDRPDAAGGGTVRVGRELVAGDFEGRCPDVAASLLGTLLVNDSPEGKAGGLVVETEAYLGQRDPACHLARDPTPRTEPFLDGAGTVYVFKIYRYDNLNVVTEHGGYPECVLVRALEPVVGRELMAERRDKTDPEALASGPGKLTTATGVTKEEVDDRQLAESSVSLFETDLSGFAVRRTRRIGVTDAEEWPFRFAVADSPFRSRSGVAPGTTPFDVDAFYEATSYW